MRTAALSDIAEINPRGPRSGELAEDRMVDFVPMAAVKEDGSMTVTEQKPYAEVAKGYTAFCDGDILLAKITPCFENNKISLARVATPYAFGSTEFHVIRPDRKRADARYLTHLLRADRIRVAGEKRMTGSGGQRRVPKAFLEEIEIPLPPLEEQKRIAAILDQADALRRLRARALDRLNALGQAIFHEMFGDVVVNTMGWPTGDTLGEIADIASGITKGRKIGDTTTRPVSYMAVSNVQDQHLKLDVVKTIDASEGEIIRYRLRRGDLLLTEGGDPDKLGRGSLWEDELPECIHQNHVFRVRLTSDRLRPLFLKWLVGSSRGKQYFFRSAKQTTGIASINKSQLSGFPLVIPPINTQLAFEQRINALERAAANSDAATTKEMALFASLQHRAFRGEL